MRETPAGREESTGYEIRVRGHLDARWATRFDGMTLSTREDGTTVLTGHAIDQAALHGVLANLRDIGVPLVSVTQSDVAGRPRPVDHAPAPHDTPHDTAPTTSRGD